MIIESNIIAAERAVLGACLLAPKAYAKVATFLRPELFYDSKHTTLWREMAAMHADGQPIDMVTVAAQLRRKKLNKEVANSFVVELTTTVASDANIIVHARAIAEAWMARQILRISNDATKLVQDGGDVFEANEWLQSELRSLTSGFSAQQSQHIKPIITRVLEAANAAAARGGKVDCATTGLALLDAEIYGFVPCELVIIAARPGMGKTAQMLATARNAAAAGAPVGILSLEMGDTELVARLICTASKTDSRRFKKGELQPYEWQSVAEACGALGNLPIVIDSEGGLSLAKAADKARKMKAEYGIKVLFIDYLQLMSGATGNRGNREQEISSITRGLKQLAKELDICVVALSQLSREVEKRSDKRPQLSDLRESGAIEQDADIVIFLYRPEYYDIEVDMDTGESLAGVCVHIIGKNRHGETKDVHINCNMSTGEFWCDAQPQKNVDEMPF